MLKGKPCCWNRYCLSLPLAPPQFICIKRKIRLSFLYVHLTYCAKLFFKHIETKIKHLLVMELGTDVTFLVLSSVNNNLFICVLFTGEGCKTRFVGTTELKNIPYITARVICTINFIVKRSSRLRLNIWLLSFLKRSKYSNGNKENTYFEAENNEEEYFRGHENIGCMMFLNNICWGNSHITSLILPLIWFMTNVILCMPKLQVLIFWFYWLLLIQ